MSPTGNDSGAGTEADPWLTPDGARANVRAAGATTTTDGETVVHFAPGRYWTAATAPSAPMVSFATADSGSAYAVRYKCDGDPGEVEWNGGRRLTGWSLVSGSIYRVAVADRVTVLWENGVMAREARSPAYVADPDFPVAQAPYLSAAGVNGSQTVVQYGVGELSPALWDLDSVRLAVWPGGLISGGSTGDARAWFQDWDPVGSVNTGSRQLTLDNTTLYPVYAGSTGGRYFAAGDLSFLTGPGQWYHDHGNGFLYYWARDGAIADQEIVIPACTNVVEFQGTDATHPVANVVLEGIKIQFGNAVYAYQVSDWSNRQLANVYLTNTANITLWKCEVANAGLNGVYAHGANVYPSVRDSYVHDCGGYGILGENYPGISADIGDVNTQGLIYDTWVDRVGLIYGEGSCVYLLNVSRWTTLHCKFTNATRAGFQLVGGAGLGSKNYVRGHLIAYSEANDVNQDSGDMGAFYVGQTNDVGQDWIQLKTDNSWANSSMRDYAPRGVMVDDNGGNQRYTDVQVTNSQGAAYLANAGGSTATRCTWGGGTPVMDPSVGLLPGFPF